jgi:hypothetical protein
MSAGQSSKYADNLVSAGPREGDGQVRFSRLTLLNGQGQVINSAATGDLLRIQLETAGYRDGTPKPSRLGINFSTLLGTCLFVCATEVAYDGPFLVQDNDCIYCDILRLPLSAGRYRLSLFLEQGGIIKDWIQDGIELLVEDKDFFGCGRNVPRGWGWVCS